MFFIFSFPKKKNVIHILFFIFWSVLRLKEIYLDNSATTKVYPEAAKKAFEIMTEKYGNPSSLHSKGLEAEHELNNARKIIADSVGADELEIYFTSGGTEGNNTAVFGAVNALHRRGMRIVTSAVEHSSVLEAMKKLENDGFEVIYLNPDKSGRISLNEIRNAVTSDTILVSIMAVNNEIGSIQPISCVKKIIAAAKSPAIFHVDAVQAFCKMPINPKKAGIDIMTVSGHKIHAPKGIGAMYIRKGTRIIPLHYGGLQEKKIRPGTENISSACAMGEAVKIMKNIQERTMYIKKLNEYCRMKISDIENIHINSDNECLPYIINFSVLGIRSETMLHFLAQNGIYVSSGSACAKGQKSHVLSAAGLSAEQIDSAIRVSFSEENTFEDIDELIKIVKTANNTLARNR